MPKDHESSARPPESDLPTFDEVMVRLGQVAGIKSQSALARELKVSPSSVSDAKGRGAFPLAWALSLARKNKVSLDRILGLPNEERNRLAHGMPPKAAWDMTERQRHLRIDSAPVGRILSPLSAVAIDGLIMVPKVAARLSAGGGSFEASAEIKGHYAFREEWLRSKGIPEDMVLMEVSGDSMEPELRDGDTVLINQGQVDVLAGKVYAVGIEDTVVVKQLERLPGVLVLRSTNPAYKSREIDMRGDLADTVRIIGRVIWWCHEAR